MRESESQEIAEFLKSTDCYFMYISGIPGCGKTYIVKQLADINYINCMCDDLRLNEQINILDEIDHVSKIHWENIKAHIDNKNKVIGIANTLDISCIPEDLLENLMVVSFAPYSASDITEIANTICNNMELDIDTKVLDFLGRKCSAIDGDIRRLSNWIKKLPDNPTIADAIKITKNSQYTMFSTMPIHAKHLLCLLFVTFQDNLQNQRKYKKLSFQQLYQLCKPRYKNKHAVPSPNFSEFVDLLNVLESKSFVNIKKGNVELDDKVDDKLFENDDVTKALYFSNSVVYSEE